MSLRRRCSSSKSETFRPDSHEPLEVGNYESYWSKDIITQMLITTIVAFAGFRLWLKILKTL